MPPMDAQEIIAFLNQPPDDLLSAIEGIDNRADVTLLFGAERRLRHRPAILDALDAHGTTLGGGDVALRLAETEADVANMVVSLARSRPVADPLPEEWGEEDLYPVPSAEDFVDERTGRIWDFMEAPDLEQIAEILFERFPMELRIARPVDIKYLWRAHATKAKGRVRLGTCQRSNGLSAFWSGTEFIIIVAADEAERLQLTYTTAQAIVFHELKHIGLNDNWETTIVGHDVETFVDELRLFPGWHEALKPITLQPNLPGFGGSAK